MSWFQIVRSDTDDTFEAIAESGFAKQLSLGDVSEVAGIISEILKGQVAQKLFEGLSQLEISTQRVKMVFHFSLDEQHMLNIENSIGATELQSHRANFVMYVFATIDQKFKLDDSFPPGFQDTLNMPQYIK